MTPKKKRSEEEVAAEKIQAHARGMLARKEGLYKLTHSLKAPGFNHEPIK